MCEREGHGDRRFVAASSLKMSKGRGPLKDAGHCSPLLDPDGGIGRQPEDCGTVKQCLCSRPEPAVRLYRAGMYGRMAWHGLM